MIRPVLELKLKSLLGFTVWVNPVMGINRAVFAVNDIPTVLEDQMDIEDG